jgi:hypothetical protein
MISYAQNAQTYIEQFSSDFEKVPPLLKGLRRPPKEILPQPEGPRKQSLQRLHPRQDPRTYELHKVAHPRTVCRRITNLFKHLAQQNKVLLETDE